MNAVHDEFVIHAEPTVDDTAGRWVRCYACHDIGLVTAILPGFVEAHREYLASLTDEDLADAELCREIFRRGRLYAHSVSKPLSYMLACTCDRGRNHRRNYEDYRCGQRTTLPAAGGVYKAAHHPITHDGGVMGFVSGARAFVLSHRKPTYAETHEWQP